MEATGHDANKRGSLKERALEELKLYWIIALYLAVLFGSMMVYRRLILNEVGVSYLHYGFAIIQALIIAKVILIGDALKIGRRFEHAPLIYSVIHKAVVFSLFTLAFGVLEHVVEGLLHRQSAAEIGRAIAAVGLDEIAARTLMLICAFIPFFAVWELGRVIGPHKLLTLFFSRQGPGSPRDEAR